jgi:branched-chain amino acid transport system permease protein
MASSSAPETRRVALGVAIAAAIVAAPFLLGEGYELHLLVISAIFTILASGLSLIVGFGGLLSLGHAAFFGIGAYTSALLFLRLGVPMWGGLIAAAVMGAFAAFLIGALVLRVRGNRFIITTVAFAEIMRLIAVNSVDLTRGQMGLAGVRAPQLAIPGLGMIDFSSKTAFYFLAVAIAALCVATVARIVRSPIGWGLAALRENERLGESLGVGAFRHAMLAFVVGGFFAGIAGSLNAHYMNFVSPDVFAFSVTTTVLVMVVIGGKTSIAGPVIGAVLFTILPELLRIADQFRLVFLGVVLLATILVFPKGLVELWQRWAARNRRPLPSRTPAE